MKTKTLAFAIGLIMASGCVVNAADVTSGKGAEKTVTIAPPVSLHQSVTVTSDYINVGDLFDGAGAYANRQVARAPEPGKRLTLDAMWLYRVAHAYDLAWRPLGNNDRAVVERAGQRIDQAQIDQEIRMSLAKFGVSDDDEVSLTQRRMEIYVATGAETSVAVENVAYDTKSHRFSCTVVSPANGHDAKRVTVQGRVFATTELPVLKHAIKKGDVITEADVMTSKVHIDDIRREAISNAAQLIGMTPVHNVRAGAAISSEEIQPPVLVAKGTLVTMLVKTPYMTLTAQGKAQDDGARNATIHVQNTASNRTLLATVIDANFVTVQQTALPAAY
ncbi:MAG: flagellar basal body P-ring formation protein FlgA [Alphaproteobacteria bacterium]|nr:flagellar basal body P-ring formation protein FlgA [Alphaproteobacteria bacterium]